MKKYVIALCCIVCVSLVACAVRINDRAGGDALPELIDEADEVVEVADEILESADIVIQPISAGNASSFAVQADGSLWACVQFI